MCGHIFLINPGLQSLQPHQPLWHCSTCGRQSNRPLDCCANPAYQVSQATSVVGILRRRLRELIKLTGWLYRVPFQFRSWLMGRSDHEMISASASVMKSEPGHSSEQVLSNGVDNPAALVSASTVSELLRGRGLDIEPEFVDGDELAESPDRVHELQVH